jgi:ribosomal protein L40E
MPELTDSYCERCGTRHVFSTSGSKGLSFKGARVLAKGLRNFVLNDGQSMSDSITTARLEDESGDSSRMTEAFHKAFNFCMTCRQYACDKCWNDQVGACLSCAPQADSEPVAPEGHLIVRTPVARWDPDWLNFSDSERDAAASVGTPSLPAEWSGPLQISPKIAPQARQDLFPPKADQPTAPAQPAAWPAADLPGSTAAEAGPSGKTGRGGRKSADPGAWSLWPVADELAPEMTLTPEEMMLVEAELNHPESSEPATASTPSVEDAASAAAGPGLEPIPARSTLPTWEPVAPSQPFGPISEPLSPPAPPAPQLTVSAAADSTAGATAETTPAPQATPAAKTRVTPESRPASPMRMAPTPVLPVQPAPSVVTRHEPVERAGFVARLFGRRGANDKAGAPNIHESAAGGGLATEPWPHATPWAESQLGGRRWRGDGADDPSYTDPRADEAAQPVAEYPADLATDLRADVPDDLVPDQTAGMPLPEGSGEPKLALTPVGALEPASSSPDSPVAAARKPADFEAALAGKLREAAALSEARSAAAIRQSAVTHSPNRPADEGAAVAEPVAQSEAPAWPEADAEVAEVARVEAAPLPAPVGQAADTSPVEPSTPPVSWPPFGASWPAPAPHSGMWPGPAAPLPAVVAAQQVQPQLVVEMWAQSSQEVMNRGTVRVCHRCALPVSTQARFCRRCGTQQG